MVSVLFVRDGCGFTVARKDVIPLTRLSTMLRGQEDIRVVHSTELPVFRPDDETLTSFRAPTHVVIEFDEQTEDPYFNCGRGFYELAGLDAGKMAAWLGVSTRHIE